MFSLKVNANQIRSLRKNWAECRAKWDGNLDHPGFDFHLSSFK